MHLFELGYQECRCAEELDALVQQMQARSWKLVHLRDVPDFEDEPDVPLSFHGNVIEAGRWVGRFSAGRYAQEIEPRVGWSMFMRMLEGALGVLVGTHTTAFDATPEKNLSVNLLAIAWYSSLKRAVSRHGLPKNYEQREETKSHVFRGSFDAEEHLMQNQVDKHCIACRYDDLTYNNMINQGIMQVVDHLRRWRLWPFLASGAQGSATRWLTSLYDRLGLMGVRRETGLTPKSWNIRWTRNNRGFRVPFTLATALLRNRGYDPQANSLKSVISCLFDVAEVWEMFVLGRIQSVVQSRPEFRCYRVVSPRLDGYQWDSLLTLGNGRWVRRLIPDYQLLNREHLVAILDAKSKSFVDSVLGVGIPKSEDIQQMALYGRYHLFGENAAPICLALLYPRCQRLNSGKQHGSGVLLGGQTLHWRFVDIDAEDGISLKDWLDQVDNSIGVALDGVIPPCPVA